MKLNEKILYYRRAAKLSQEELAARIGVSRQAVSKWELGESTPEVDKLVALSRLFGVTTDELLGEGEPSQGREPSRGAGVGRHAVGTAERQLLHGVAALCPGLCHRHPCDWPDDFDRGGSAGGHPLSEAGERARRRSVVAIYFPR